MIFLFRPDTRPGALAETKGTEETERHMAKLAFDSGLMYAAISSPHHAGETGYLNRKSGEILFVFEKDEDAEECFGCSAAENTSFRAHIAANPEEWIAVPRNVRLPLFHEPWCDVRTAPTWNPWTPCTCGFDQKARREREDDDAFIHDFLKANGIEAGGWPPFEVA